MRLYGPLPPLLLAMLLSGCVIGKIDDSALCSGLNPLVDAHVDALIEDGGPKSVVTGERFVAGYDGVCHAV